MNMSYPVFFILVCLGPAAVISGQYHWVPKNVASPANQCTSMGFQGQCKPVVYSSICQQLMCARLVHGEYRRVSAGRGAWDGTQCGKSSVCKRSVCTEIPKHKMPKSVRVIPQEFDCVVYDSSNSFKQ